MHWQYTVPGSKSRIKIINQHSLTPVNYDVKNTVLGKSNSAPLPINMPHSHLPQHHLIPINMPQSHLSQHHLISINMPHSHLPQHHLIPINIPHSHLPQHHLIPINMPHSHLPQQFSDFFTDKTEQIRQNLDTTPSRNSHRNPPHLATPLSEFCSVSEEAILGITKKLHQKCCELDPIPTSLVYESTELLPAITSIISDSFQSDVFPHVFKRELVKPAQCVFVVQVFLL